MGKGPTCFGLARLRGVRPCSELARYVGKGPEATSIVTDATWVEGPAFLVGPVGDKIILRPCSGLATPGVDHWSCWSPDDTANISRRGCGSLWALAPGFALTREEAAGRWGAATYSLICT